MTLLELMTVLALIGLLFLMILPIYPKIADTLEKYNCANNLRALHTAASAYIQDHQSWPQVANRNIFSPEHAREWEAALEDYGIDRKNWVCPTIQKKLENPDLTDDRNFRLDYIATPFGPSQFEPFKYSTQPWFAERADVHGDGNLLIFPDGRVIPASEFFQN